MAIRANVILMPKVDYLGMALQTEKKFFGQIMNSQKAQSGQIQINIAGLQHGATLKFKLPFRCEMQESHPPLQLQFGFLLPKVTSSYDSPPVRKPTH